MRCNNATPPKKTLHHRMPRIICCWGLGTLLHASSCIFCLASFGFQLSISDFARERFISGDVQDKRTNIKAAE